MSNRFETLKKCVVGRCHTHTFLIGKMRSPSDDFDTYIYYGFSGLSVHLMFPHRTIGHDGEEHFTESVLEEHNKAHQSGDTKELQWTELQLPRTILPLEHQRRQ